MFDQALYNKAWLFAAKAHNGQTMTRSSDLPYIVHLSSVAMEVIAGFQIEPATNIDLAVQCALLHDVIEDTDVSYQDVKGEFGGPVADGVLALTKNESLPTKQEQMQDSLQRIKQQPKSVGMVKLADRITNLQKPPAHWSLEKIKKYQFEAQLIYQELESCHQYLAQRLKSKIESYNQYFV